MVRLVAGQQHPQPVPDGDALGDHEEAVGEAGVPRAVRVVQRLPGDEHRHDNGLARACGHLQRRPGQAGVVHGVRLVETATPVGAGPPASPGDLGQEDRRLCSLTLADGIARVGAG